MRESRIATRYARSLLDLAVERKELEVAHDDMQAIVKTIDESPDLELLLKSPVVKRDVKQNIINKVFRGQLSEMTQNFVEIILRKGRESLLKPIADEFINQYKEHLGIVTAHVTTAIKLDDNLRNKVLEAVKSAGGEKVDLIERVDEEIIGGIVVRVGDHQVDATIQRKINNLKQEFVHNPFIADF